MNPLIDQITSKVRRLMLSVAKLLNTFSGGRISPDAITWTGLVMHIVIAWLIAGGRHGMAAVLLVIFGLFDALDGALARLQNKSGNAGMLLDATTDRMKEVLLYTGAAYYFIRDARLLNFAVWAVAACGTSLCVSYVKAKGETAVKDTKLSPSEVNRLFGDGFARFQVRMLLLVVGLAINRVEFAIVLITLLAILTTVSRLAAITKRLR